MHIQQSLQRLGITCTYWRLMCTIGETWSFYKSDACIFPPSFASRSAIQRFIASPQRGMGPSSRHDPIDFDLNQAPEVCPSAGWYRVAGDSTAFSKRIPKESFWCATTHQNSKAGRKIWIPFGQASPLTHGVPYSIMLWQVLQGNEQALGTALLTRGDIFE